MWLFPWISALSGVAQSTDSRTIKLIKTSDLVLMHVLNESLQRGPLTPVTNRFPSACLSSSSFVLFALRADYVTLEVSALQTAPDTAHSQIQVVSLIRVYNSGTT